MLSKQNGIVFVDEMDKVTSRSRAASEVSVAPGCAAICFPSGFTVSTKYGVRSKPTTFCSSPQAFHLSKPSDLIPELQGRFPTCGIAVSVGAGTCRHPDPNSCPLVKQYQALLATENATIEF
jgi:ATP-dependent HslUV protease ATP-binding subunit HslU